MRRWWMLVVTVGALLALSGSAAAAGVTIDVTQAGYGAVGDGATNDRGAIQRALDDVAADGGGTVVIPSGRTFLTGSLKIGSGTTVRLDGNAAAEPGHGALQPGRRARPRPRDPALAVGSHVARQPALPLLFALDRRENRGLRDA